MTSLGKHIARVGVAWTLLVAAAVGLSLWASYNSMLEQARVAARVAFEKDLTFRRWNAMNGGVYVPVNDQNRPNPFLDVPDRDVETVDGTTLTMVNPAYMSRQAYEIQKDSADVQGHITSLNPIHPGNQADPWERKALESFATGNPEVSSRETIAGKPFLRIMRPVWTEEQCLKCHAKQGYKAGDLRGGISVSVPLSGHLKQFYGQAGQTIGGHGLIWGIGLTGIVTGGRRLRRSIRQEREARVAAESSNQAKSEFLANMSHEIRTPLNGVLGMLQLMRAMDSPEEQAEYAEMAYDSGRRLLDLLNDVLDLSRMEVGGLVLFQEVFSLRETFDSVANLFQATCAEKRLALSFQVDESVPEQLVGDEARLRQVLFNLVGNAVKFTPKGSVRVTAWARPSLRPPGRVLLYIEVLDTGIGIPGDKLGHVFERFTQADGSYSRRFEGAGLGLAIVRRIVEIMGGSIAVDSEEGAGSTFCVRLLLDVKPEQETSSAQDKYLAQQGGGAPLRILLVEDEPVSKLSTQLLLSRLGHVVVAADNGFEAVALQRNGEFDCVLMDVQMPQMDGVEATRVIRKLEKEQGRARVPIIALTAYAMSGDRERFLAEGMDGHVAKPVQVEDLERSLRRICSAVRA